MSMKSTGILFAAALLGACGGQAPTANQVDEAAANTAVDLTNYQAEVIALHPRQQQGVMLRALRDARLDCQQITGFKRIEDMPNKARWQVICDERSPYVVEISANGEARIRSRR